MKQIFSRSNLNDPTRKWQEYLMKLENTVENLPGTHLSLKLRFCSEILLPIMLSFLHSGRQFFFMKGWKAMRKDFSGTSHVPYKAVEKCLRFIQEVIQSSKSEDTDQLTFSEHK